jgi:uncharacterized glyoxalase superfamily protein PhnB
MALRPLSSPATEVKLREIMAAIDHSSHVAALRHQHAVGLVMIAGPFDERAKARLRTALADYRDVTEEPWPNLSYSITTMVPDVDAHHEAARAEGAQILVPPQDRPWGLRDYEVLDLEGLLWNLSQHLNDVEPEDWGAKPVPTAPD